MLLYNGNQLTVNPNPNNCCGGFALAAVLYQLNKIAMPALGTDNYGINAPAGIAGAANNIPGILTYRAIQEFQAEFPNGSVQRNFLNGTLERGTRRSLPSAIIRVALNAGFNGQIMLTHIPADEMPPGLGMLVTAETATIHGFNAGVAINNGGDNEYPGLPPANTLRIILCHSGAHWVACDNEAYYDPNGGDNDIPNTDGFGAYGGLFIDFVFEAAQFHAKP